MTAYRILLIMFALATTAPHAQSVTERDAVLRTIQIFFDTMAVKDVNGARTIMVPQARFFAMDLRKPASEPRSVSTEEYLAELQQSKQTLRERIWSPEVRVHGAIATVWAPYDFWTDGKYSHCGIDAFDLIKTAEGWQVAGGVFTVEAKCAPSPLGPPKP